MKYDAAVSGAVILSSHNGYQPFIGAVGVRDGRIAAVTEHAISPSECREWVDGSDRILMPGLVNAHCHGDMTLARGMGDGLTLLEQNGCFADTNWFRTLISDAERADSRLLTYAEALLSGTVFIMENMYWSLGTKSPELMAKAGIHGAAAEDIRKDFARPEIFIEERELAAFKRRCIETGILPVIGSVSEEDYEPELVRRIRGVSEAHGLMQTFHMTESTWRVEKIREQYGMTPVTWLAENGVLGPDVIGSHVVWLDEREIEMLAESGTSVANTPLCEMKIADGAAPIAEMVKRGVNVCLGTDGAMWNNSSDLFREMKGMALLQSVTRGVRALCVRDILDMATVNGARAFGLADEFGTIEEGKRADFILIRTDAPHMQPLRLSACENVTSSVVFNATGRDVTDVFTAGRRVVADGRLTSMNARALWERVGMTSQKIADHYKNKN